MRKRAPRRRRAEEVASLRQTLQLKDDNQNEIQQLAGLSLSAFDRASQVARAYQYFRITRIDMKFKPYADTYIPSASLSNATMPYLYWLINKGDVLDVSDFNGLRDAGAKPIRFDDKTINVSFKPAVLMFASSSQAAPGTNPSFNVSKVSPWLTTNDLAGTVGAVWTASSLEHHGFTYGVESAINGDPQMIYGVELTAHFEFKKPLNVTNPPADSQVVINQKVVAKA